MNLKYQISNWVRIEMFSNLTVHKNYLGWILKNTDSEAPPQTNYIGISRSGSEDSALLVS